MQKAESDFKPFKFLTWIDPFVQMREERVNIDVPSCQEKDMDPGVSDNEARKEKDSNNENSNFEEVNNPIPAGENQDVGEKMSR